MNETSVLNPSIAKSVRTMRLDFQDSKNALLRLNFVDIGKDPENPNEYCNVTIDHNSSTDTKLIVLLDIGASATDYTQYQFSAYATGITDPAGVDSSPTHTQVTTLGALILALNAVDGVKAYRLNAPADYSLDTDDFITQTAFRLGALFVDCLYKDASEVLTAAIRIGIPEEMDHGSIKIHKVIGFANSNSATDCVFKISRDPSESDATEEEEIGFTRYVPDNAITTLWDEHENPPTIEGGPLLVEITATTSLAEGAWVLVSYSNADY